VAVSVGDALTEVLRSGARELLQQAVEAEVAEFVARHRELKDERERQRVVRNGYRPERSIQTGIGEVDGEGAAGARIVKARSNFIRASCRLTCGGPKA
jgi:hypothetical protein